MLNFNEYKIMVETEQADKEFKPLNNYYIYRGVIIDYNYDYSDCESDDFDPFYQKGYTRLVGDKVDYVHNALILNYKNDTQKYKADIINFIDRKIEKHKKN